MEEVNGSRKRKENPAVAAGEITKDEVKEAAEKEEKSKGKERVGDDTYPARSEPPEDEQRPRPEGPKRPSSYWKVTRTDLMYSLLLSSGLVLLSLLWALLIAYGGVTNRYIWISCLFAPFGTRVTLSLVSNI
jgi:hypothetical protein